MDARRLGLAAMAFFAGALVGALALEEASPLASAGRSDRLVVRVENVGSHAATADVDVFDPFGGSLSRWRWELAPGQGDEQAVRASREVAVKPTVQWSATADAARGDVTRLADPSRCAAGESLRVEFFVDTSRGVSFRVDARCAA